MIQPVKQEPIRHPRRVSAVGPPRERAPKPKLSKTKLGDLPPQPYALWSLPVEAGLLTLAKIVATLVVSIGIVPLLFLLAPGSREEPDDHFGAGV